MHYCMCTRSIRYKLCNYQEVHDQLLIAYNYIIAYGVSQLTDNNAMCNIMLCIIVKGYKLSMYTQIISNGLYTTVTIKRITLYTSH